MACTDFTGTYSDKNIDGNWTVKQTGCETLEVGGGWLEFTSPIDGKFRPTSISGTPAQLALFSSPNAMKIIVKPDGQPTSLTFVCKKQANGDVLVDIFSDDGQGQSKEAMESLLVKQ
jgi:hypothetical protein